MNKRSLGALIALNIVLLAGLLIVTLTPQTAQAQRRGRSHYTMISGRTNQKSSYDIVYLINVDTAQLAALMYEEPNDRFVRVGRYDFSGDLQGRTGGR
ncbi:MAG: hypothetical protein CMJ18_11150 [Phycisphaeraceae bacterium]|nr:hypothetical protein [Phycisphaeraceae bacterium]